MQLTIFNGSPRKSRGNSEILINKFLDGFLASDETITVNYLAEKEKMREFVGKFQNAENILLVFPLYADSMPALVKDFIENLQDMQMYPDKQKIAFIVHCGFPDAIQLRAIEKYLIKLSDRLDIGYIGTILKPGSEGLRVAPERLNKKLFKQLNDLGKEFRKTGSFDPAILQSIAKKDRFPSIILPLIKLMNKLGLFNVWWNRQLKQNKAYAKRFDKPFEVI